jgi:hypothetical protein
VFGGLVCGTTTECNGPVEYDTKSLPYESMKLMQASRSLAASRGSSSNFRSWHITQCSGSDDVKGTSH